MAILDDVKVALRIAAATTAYDGEVQDLIDACETDLALAGLLVIDETDALTKRAIQVYCKANFGYDNPDADRLQKSYDMLKNHLSMSSDYAYYTVTITAVEQGPVEFDGVTKETNASGVVVFYSRTKNHVEYTMDGTTGYIDIAGNTVIGGGI